MHLHRLVAVVTALLVCGPAVASEDPSDPDFRIRFYEAKLAEHPNLFAGFAQLGGAYLDKARETHDVAWLAKARTALERSLEIQPNLNALVLMASLYSYSHRFAQALELADRAGTARADDLRIRSIRVEALLGLGRTEEVEQLLVSTPAAPGDALLRAARGRWLAELKRYDEARDAFVEAATLAREAKATDLAVWSETNAAGMLLDSGRAEPALPHLEAAASVPAVGVTIQRALQIHWAEYHALRGEAARALEIYEELLAQGPDAELARRAFVLATKLDDGAKAESLFEQAELAAERILAAGEIFALETHAKLYADAGVKLERAEQLALRNLEFKRDRSARETLAYVRDRRGAGSALRSTPGSSSPRPGTKLTSSRMPSGSSNSTE